MRYSIHDAFDALHADEGMKKAALDAYRREADRREGRAHRRAFRPVLAALCTLVLLTGALGVTAYAVPVSYISIDSEPSVQLSLNRFDRVVGATALNAEGEALLKELSLNGLYYTEAMEAVVDSEVAQPYLTDEGEITFTVASPREEALTEGIRNSECGQRGACQSLPADAVKDAAACGLSLGKYRMYLLIHPLLDDFAPEDCGGMSMRRLRELYHSLTEGGSNGGDDGGDGNGNGYGGGNGSGNGNDGGYGYGGGNGKGYEFK